MTTYMSINIGGTWTRFCIAQGGAIVAYGKEKTILEGADTSIPLHVIEIYKKYLASGQIRKFSKVKLGVSFAGLVQHVRGGVYGIASNICGGLKNNINSIPNNWISVNFNNLFSEFDEVVIRNDVVAEMIMEHAHGALVDYKHCAYINWGTGVGAGIVIDNKILEGKRGMAGHVGHQFVSDASDKLCGCGNIGDLESIVGAKGIESAYSISGRELFRRAGEQDEIASNQVDSLLSTFSRGVFNLLAILDLEAVCFGGAVFNGNPEYILDRINKNMKAYSPLFTSDVNFHKTILAEKLTYTSGFGEIALHDELRRWLITADFTD